MRGCSSLFWNWAVAAATVAALFCAPVLAEQRNLTVDGRARMYLIERPVGCAVGSPVLFWFHGGLSGSAQEVHDSQALHATGECAIVVYPQACRRLLATNTCKTEGEWSIGDLWGPWDRDLRYLDAVRADVLAREVTNGVLYAGGMSRGGFFTYFALYHRDYLARGAVVAGGLEGLASQPTVAEPLLHMHDPADPLVCWDAWKATCGAADTQHELAIDGFMRWVGWTSQTQLTLTPGTGHTFPLSHRAVIWNWLLRP